MAAVSRAVSRASELSDPSDSNKGSPALKCRLGPPSASVANEMDLRITPDLISSQLSVPLSGSCFGFCFRSSYSLGSGVFYHHGSSGSSLDTSEQSMKHMSCTRRHVYLIPRFSISSSARKKRPEDIESSILDPSMISLSPLKTLTGFPQRAGSSYLPWDLLLSMVHSRSLSIKRKIEEECRDSDSRVLTSFWPSHSQHFPKP